jgi:hypothetical protein
MVMGSAGERDQTTWSLLLKAAQPLADGRDGGLKQTSRGFDAELAGGVDQTQAMVVGVFHFPEQGEERNGDRERW